MQQIQELIYTKKERWAPNDARRSLFISFINNRSDNMN